MSKRRLLMRPQPYKRVRRSSIIGMPLMVLTAMFVEMVANKSAEYLNLMWFSLANSICGYAIKNPANRIDYSSYNNWEKINCIDNVLGNYIKYDEFNNRKEKPISENTINILKIEIDELINKFLKN